MRRRPLNALTITLTTALATLIGLLTAPAALGTEKKVPLRLNQVQVIGTHNSYHREATPAESALRALVSPEGQKALEYAHPALRRQFGRQQVRQIELDIWADPDGGLYAEPLLRTLTLGGPYDPVMKQPGTKVLHIQDIDYHSNCLTFIACLRAVKKWSDAHRSHLPIAVLVEFKDTPLSLTDLQAARIRRASPGSDVAPATVVTPVPWTAARMDTVDADIRSIFPARRLITPDDVRKHASTLEDAVLTRGWPTLAESRGRVMFLMDNGGTYRESYLAGHPSLRGRVLFTNATPGQPDAAFIKENDPTGANQARIQDEVRRGYLVRTRADTDTVQARTGDTTMRDAALASGAQWVSTDYPVLGPALRFGTTYSVRIPGGARCTPVAPVNVAAPCTRAPSP
jgi:hypothetical protein